MTQAYTLAMTLLAPVNGRVSDIVGRKPLLYCAIVIFVVFSALCGAAKNMTWSVSSLTTTCHVSRRQLEDTLLTSPGSSCAVRSRVLVAVQSSECRMLPSPTRHSVPADKQQHCGGGHHNAQKPGVLARLYWRDVGYRLGTRTDHRRSAHRAGLVAVVLLYVVPSHSYLVFGNTEYVSLIRSP